MTNDIKEILDELKEKNQIYKECNENGIIENEYYKAHLLLDYITNLQEENKEWSMIFDTFSKRPYAHKYLEEKKKELGNKKIIGLDSEMIYKDYYDYKSRNEKAIEYIKNEMPYLQEVDEEFENVDGEVYFTYKEWNGNELLNILQGSDKDE